MKRILTQDLHSHIGKEVTLAGWVDVRRDHGKLIFIDLRDRTGVVQMVALPDKKEVHKKAEKIRSEWVVQITGNVNERPSKMVNEKTPTGDIEIEITKLEILTEARELPFDLNTDLNLDTYLDALPLTLRSKRAQDIFTLQATIVDAFRDTMKKQGFIEYQNPVLVGSDGEGGASAFKVDYYNDKTALLATSPQLYKQMMVGVFERVFTTTKVFRAEKHATTRHLSEVVQMDFEMGFIESHEDVMCVLEKSVQDIVQTVLHQHEDMLSRFFVENPLVPKAFPRLTLREAQEILGVPHDPDLEPQGERDICTWVKDKHKSDFVFITHFPTRKRPFYTSVDEKDGTYSKSFDLLFRGLEINSGSQRVHVYDELLERIEEKGLDPRAFAFYLQAFKYGMPPHGGCSTGLERFTARMLELDNVKETTLFPREINRIDTLLSQ